MKARRVIRFSTLCLLLGAATTVGVAWGLLWRLGEPELFGAPVWEQHEHLGPEARKQGWPTDVPRDWPAPEEWRSSRTFGVYQVSALLVPRGGDGLSGTAQRSASEVRSGWPFLALEHSLMDPSGVTMPMLPAPSSWSFMSWRMGIWVNGRYNGFNVCEAYPCYPLIAGLCADAAIYGLAWGLALASAAQGARRLLHRHRVRKGRCGACGYDLKGSAGGVCPECGRIA